MTLLELIRTNIKEPRMLYLAKKYNKEWNIPNKVEVLNANMMVVSKAWESVDESQLKRTTSRLECEEIQESLHNILKWKVPFKKLLAFNEG